MKIASFDEPRPRGVVIGRQATGPRLTEAENYFRCDKCSGWFDARDLAWVEDHEGPLPHPAQDRAQ
jgi:hypothetical protein